MMTESTMRLPTWVANAVFKLGCALPPLHSVAASGDLRDLRSMIADPQLDVDALDGRGRTALHLAAKGGHFDVAVELLRRGASHTLVDRNGRRPLVPPNVTIETLHAIRQRFKRSSPIDAANRPDSSNPRVTEWLSTLNRDGFLKLSGLISPSLLASMQSGFAKFIANLEQRRSRGEADMKTYDEEEHWWAQDLAYVSNNAFKYSSDLARFCCHPDLIELADRYLGQSASITRGVAMRYLPHTQRDNDMFGWHHDMEEKRFKIMILLSDVGDQDQGMSYVARSHTIYHPYEMFFRNSCTLDYCRSHLGELDVRQTTGVAGDVFVFDSNGIHRGNRRPEAKIRDTFFIEFDTDLSHPWGGDVNASAFEGLEFPRGNPFAAFLSTEKKWNLQVERKLPSWLEYLPDVERWR